MKEGGCNLTRLKRVKIGVPLRGVARFLETHVNFLDYDM